MVEEAEPTVSPDEVEPDQVEPDGPSLEQLTAEVAEWLVAARLEPILVDPDGWPAELVALIDQVGESDSARAAAVWADLVAAAGAGPGLQHPNALQARGHWARWLGASGQAQRGLSEVDAVVAEQTRQLGPDHRDTLTSRVWQADLIGAAGDLERSIEQLEAVLADQRALWPGPNFDTITTRSLLSQRLGEAGRQPEGLSLAIEVMEDIPLALAAIFEEVDQILDPADGAAPLDPEE
ncbi:MAG: hypothetical protein LBL55_08135 [Propionibacteriaceae bacterium]|jgi:hypothetical protein|nr:hypothetical protein [Propionibacteriaceae bacterium]